MAEELRNFVVVVDIRPVEVGILEAVGNFLDVGILLVVVDILPVEVASDNYPDIPAVVDKLPVVVEFRTLAGNLSHKVKMQVCIDYCIDTFEFQHCIQVSRLGSGLPLYRSLMYRQCTLPEKIVYLICMLGFLRTHRRRLSF